MSKDEPFQDRINLLWLQQTIRQMHPWFSECGRRHNIKNIPMANFMCIKNIQHLLTKEATESLVLSLCVSHLDYCNMMLYGLPDVTLSKFQRVQNMCAHLVLRRLKWESVKQCLATLHWLPVRQRITYKIAVLTYKLLHNEGPEYLKEMPQFKKPTRQLRSSTDNHLLVIPTTKFKTFTKRSFSVASPTIWNSLPISTRMQSTLLKFKSDLKTILFRQAFSDLSITMSTNSPDGAYG